MIAASCSGPRLHAAAPRADSRNGWSPIVSTTDEPGRTGRFNRTLNSPRRAPDAVEGNGGERLRLILAGQ